MFTFKLNSTLWPNLNNVYPTLHREGPTINLHHLTVAKIICEEGRINCSWHEDDTHIGISIDNVSQQDK